jgi:putative peptidoglycan lipid II flippase
VDPNLAPVAPPPTAGPLSVATTDPALTGQPAVGLPLRRAATYVAVGTGISRVTGLLRFVALAWALGQSPLADAFNLANTTPNMLYDIVLGGVLSATFIPVFVEQLTNRDEPEAFESISTIISVSIVVLVVSTVAALALAPELIRALTVLDTHSHTHSPAQVLVERSVATSLLRWFVIEIAGYGLFALGVALLNTRRRFTAAAWAPIVNNLVCIGVLVWFGLVTHEGAQLQTIQAHRSDLILLGLGTALGVVFQSVALIPSLRGAQLGLIRWRWNLRDAALRTVVRLSGWTFGFVLANQIALFVVTVLAGTAAGRDPVSSYTYAYAFLQLPYGIVAVSIMSVVTPELAQRWSSGREVAFVSRLATGLRAMLALIIPAAVGMLILAKPAVALLLGHGDSTPAETIPTADALAMFALGLPGFCTYLYIVRVLQSMQRTRVAFYLYLVENALNIVLAVVLVHPLGVRGLALSLSIAYSAGALLGLTVLRQWFGRLGTPDTWAPLRRVLVASVPMAAVVLVVSNLSGSTSGLGLLIRVVGSLAAGLVTFGAAIVWMGRRHDAMRRAARTRVVP